MKNRFLFSAVFIVTLLAVSCTKDSPKEGKAMSAVVSGIVVDGTDKPVKGASVSFVTADSKKEKKAEISTGTDGKFSVEVTSEGRVVNVTKDSYASYSTTISESDFESGTIDLGKIVLEFSGARIEGKVFDIEEELYEGVTVKCNDKTAVTDADGLYVFDGLTVKDYTLYYEDKDGNTAEQTVSSSDFLDGVAYPANITLGTELLPGLSYSKFVSSPYWYGNAYAGGYGAFQAQWNNVGFLTAYPIQANNWRNAAEGISLYSDSGNKGQLCAYFYGRKQITSGNCYVNICARNFGSSEGNPAKLGIGVIDLNSGSKKITYLPSQAIYQGLKKMNGGTSTLDVEHNLFVFDLSEYAGGDIAFAIGVFGGYDGGETQTPIVKILFADKDMTEEFEASNLTATFAGEKPEGCDWHGFTKANISSLTPNDGTSFSGAGMDAENDGANVGCDYSPWSGTNHLMMSWATSIINESYSPLLGNLFSIMGNRGLDYNAPSNYIASRFISPKPLMTMKLRSNNESEATVFRVTVVDLSDYSSKALQPTNENLSDIGVKCLGSEANGCLSILHCSGSDNEPEKLAELSFDLSSYSGEDVIIAIGAYGGVDNQSSDHSLSIYSIDFK